VAFLTIDDVPSRRFPEKLTYLKREGIPALLFCVGAQAKGREEELVVALLAGCELGNHSFNHPRFSEIGLDEGIEEIAKTDALLRAIYDRASIPWERKYFRFPYFDRGGEAAKASSLQDALRELGYRPPSAQAAGGFDVGCSFDQAEYRLERKEALARIDPSHPGAGDVILIHDHEKSHELFFECVDGYRKNGLRFESLA
jgi:peptidoglycan/xylan/chitin deacetylase (PgdA/CDA1 family)